MPKSADRVIAEILHAEDTFLVEIGRLTLLFSRIEDCLVNDARLLAALSEDEDLRQEAAAPALLRLRVLEKRDFLKRVYAEITRYYGVGSGRVDRILDELGEINSLRRTIVHGWLRWSEAEQQPVLVDSRGQSVPAWPNDIVEVNLKVLAWYQNYYEEQHATMGAVMDAYDDFVARLAAHQNLPAAAQEVIAYMKTSVRRTERA